MKLAERVMMGADHPYASPAPVAVVCACFI